MVGTWQKKGNILGLGLLSGPPSDSEGFHRLAEERKDEATLPPTGSPSGPPSFPRSTATFGEGAGHRAGAGTGTAFCGLGWEKRRGLRERERGVEN